MLTKSAGVVEWVSFAVVRLVVSAIYKRKIFILVEDGIVTSLIHDFSTVGEVKFLLL